MRSQFRMAIASTMVVLRDPGEVFLLCHTGGDEAISWVEQIDPVSLATVRRSPDLPGGPTWPGGLAAHADGSLYVAFGAHVHRLSAELELLASRRMPRTRPYNSFVVLPDGHVVTKDFAGVRPGDPNDAHADCELVVLRPGTLEIAARAVLPEPSVARISADGDDVYVVCDRTLQRLHWTGSALVHDAGFAPVYRTLEGQTYGWDPVIVDGAAWFLDDGAGTEHFAGSFVGVGRNACPLHLVRVDLASAAVELAEVCGAPDGLIANPPIVDPVRRIAVGYDSSNTTVTAWSYDEPFTELRPRWQRSLGQAMHPICFSATGELVMNDHDPAHTGDQVVVLDIETGDELGRVDSGSPVQGVLFGAPGWHDDVYVVSFAGVSRVWRE